MIKKIYHLTLLATILYFISPNNNHILANANDQPNTRTNEEQLTYTINSELQVIEKKMETYKEMIALESKKAKVLETIRAEVLNGNNIIGKRDGEVETTWTLEELAQQVLYESANMNYYRRALCHHLTLNPLIECR